MRATGEFTRVEIKQMRERLGTVRFNLDRLEEALCKKQATAAEGSAEARARKIGAALKDPNYRAALRALDAAEVVKDRCALAFGRCGVSAKTGKLTKTGEKRKAEKFAAVRAMDAARIAFRELDAGYGGVAAGGPNVGPRLSESRLKGDLRELIRSYKIGDLPEEIAEAQEEHDRLEERLRVAEAHRVTDAKLEAVARYLDVKPCKLLVKLAVEDYKPQPATIVKLDEEVAALVEIGLVRSSERLVLPTNLGKDVARWVADNMPGQAAASRPALTPAEIRACFTQKQLAEMVAKGRRALALIAREGPGVENLELGLPEEGVSYRIMRTADAVRVFLAAVGSGLKTKRQGEGPRILRKKRPVFVPGRILEEDSSPCGVA